MKLHISKGSGICVVAVAMALQGCTDYDPVPVSDCGKVVRHAQKVLGSMAPGSADMLKDCKAASDSERGCVMAATKKGKLAQCM